MKADLHIHTNFSYDGVSSPKEIVESALEKGIGCICITDHGQIKGAIEAMKFGYDKNLLVVPGIEIISSAGEILGINVKKIIPNNLSPEETIKEIRNQGGIAVIPHPFARHFSGFWGGEKMLRLLNIDAIEVFNANIPFSRLNRRSFEFAKKINLPFTAGSDAHRAEYLGSAYLEFSKDIQSAEDLIKEILKKSGIIGGQKLGFRKTFRNSANANVAKMISYFALRLKNRKRNKNVKKASIF